MPSTSHVIRAARVQLLDLAVYFRSRPSCHCHPPHGLVHSMLATMRVYCNWRKAAQISGLFARVRNGSQIL